MKPLFTAYISVVYLFLYVPLAVLGLFSFNASKLSVWRGFTLGWYSQVFHDSSLLESATNSLIIVVATLLSTVIGTLAAYAIWKKRAPVFTSSLYLSLVTPEIVTGVSLLVFFQMIFRTLRVQLGIYTVILAHISFCLAYVVLVVLARLRTFDATLEEAALDLGANHWEAFRLVTFF